ncbi:MAG TPA: hypothetical protein VHO06_04990 [Polyangia bacterium]|nr:hypothetical protein [Polyangia bacterium]
MPVQQSNGLWFAWLDAPAGIDARNLQWLLAPWQTDTRGAGGGQVTGGRATSSSSGEDLVIDPIRADGSLGGEFGPIVEDEAPPPSPVAVAGVEGITATGAVGPSVTVPLSGVTAAAEVGVLRPLPLPMAPGLSHMACAGCETPMLPADAVCRHCVDLLIAETLMRVREQFTAEAFAEVAKMLSGSLGKAN